mgnify:CR=1 FL=1
MSTLVKIKKGLDIPLSGVAGGFVETVDDVSACALFPADYIGLTPRLLVQEGDWVTAGTPLICDKHDVRQGLFSPVTGRVKAVVRAEKRVLQAVVIERANPVEEAREETLSTLSAVADIIRSMIRQRPFGTMASPDVKPTAVYISCCDSAPLAAQCDVTLQGREEEFRCGIDRLADMVAPASVHVTYRKGALVERLLSSREASGRVALHEAVGPHPIGLVGTQIAQISPMGPDDVVWTVDPQDVANIGRLLLTGRYAPERVVAVCGPAAARPHYCRTVAGACLSPLLEGQINESTPQARIIAGNVLTGIATTTDGYLHAQTSELTLLPEGEYYDFLGWLRPNVKRYSLSRTFLSGNGSVRSLLQRYMPRMNRYLQLQFDTNRHGDLRPLIFSTPMERVFPLDIYPMQLIKAAATGDVEQMVRLGIREVLPEDFALCEFVDPSKNEIQQIIAAGIEQCRKEMCR